MPRAKKDGRYVNIYMEKPLADTLERYSAETHIPKTAIIEMAVREYMEQHGAEIKADTEA